jgi:hypothetical protein
MLLDSTTLRCAAWNLAASAFATMVGQIRQRKLQMAIVQK